MSFNYWLYRLQQIEDILCMQAQQLNVERLNKITYFSGWDCHKTVIHTEFQFVNSFIKMTQHL